MRPGGESGATAAAPRARRARRTSPRVVWLDRAARSAITLGGLSVIVAVLGILIYLLAVVGPLFSGARLAQEGFQSPCPVDANRRILFAEVDEYRAAGLCALSSGEVLTFDGRTGAPTGGMRLFPEGETSTAFSRSAQTGGLAIGFADGTVRLGRLAFETSFDPDGGRRVAARASLGERIAAGGAGGVVLLDFRVGGSGSRLAVLQQDGRLTVSEVVERRNLISGEVRRDLSSVVLPPPSSAGGTPPAFLLIATQGDQVYLAWRDGTTARYDLRDPAAPALAETADLTPAGGTRLTALIFMLGEQSLLAGDSGGLTRAWFRVPRRAGSLDGFALVPAHTFEAHAAPVTAIAHSLRNKCFATAAADGSVLLHHMTSERTLARARVDPPESLAAVQIAPKGDGLMAVGAGGTAGSWSLDNPHPEVSLKSLFSKVWYEGYPEPAWTWQSSSGTDDFEPKLSLFPLVFGTFKATFYSMLLAVPIALCAALYTSEFLDRRHRTSIKSVIEMMASLPSVVLGFLAALILAPFVESWVLAVLAAFGLVPLSALAVGYAVQTLPPRAAWTLSGRVQALLMLLAVAGSLWAAATAAGPAERLLFDGDFKGWLDGRHGSAVPGWGLLFWLPSTALLLLLDRRYLASAVERRLAERPPRAAATVELAKFAALLAASVVLAWAAAEAATAMGMDPRGSLLGTYVQRNALVVGFVMGFAVIPIIYTIAEDALSSVPHALRSASLGCGATRWQTATRVVLPVAAPGIFSALMVGLGRAVGETMIVLMAAGNTPLIDFSVFNGLRTLSANIAVELPEAVKDGTLYRMLFLAALMLFAMTFVVNTLAEIVRQRFRRRTYQL